MISIVIISLFLFNRPIDGFEFKESYLSEATNFTFSKQVFSNPIGDNDQSFKSTTTTTWEAYKNDPARTATVQSSVPSNTPFVKWNYYGSDGFLDEGILVVGNRVFAQLHESIHCVNNETGAHIWSRTYERIFCTPAYYDNRLYFTQKDFDENEESLVCINADDGSILWSVILDGCSDTSPLVIDGKVIVGYWKTDYDIAAICLDAYDHSFVWDYAITGIYIGAYMASANGKVYIFDDDDDKIYCVTLDSGTHIWTKDLSLERMYFIVCPVALSDKVLVSTDEGVYCLSSSNGATLWKQSNVYDSDHTTIACNNQYVLVMGNNYDYDEYLYCLDLSDGSIEWQYSVYDNDGFTVIANDKVLYCDGSYLTCLDLATGAFEWEFHAEGVLYCFTVAYGHIYYVTAYDLYCLSSNPATNFKSNSFSTYDSDTDGYHDSVTTTFDVDVGFANTLSVTVTAALYNSLDMKIAEDSLTYTVYENENDPETIDLGSVPDTGDYYIVVEVTDGYTDPSDTWTSSSIALYELQYDPDAPTIDHPADVNYYYGESSNSITWNPSDTYPNYYYLYRESVLIDSNTWDGSSLAFSVDGLDVGNYNYTIVVEDVKGNLAKDTVFVTVFTPELSISNPTSLDSYTKGEEISITWDTQGVIDTVSIYLYQESTLIESIVESLTNVGGYSWVIPQSIVDGFYTIIIHSSLQPSISDTSEEFEIYTPPDITGPSIASVIHLPATPTDDDEILIQAQVTDDSGVQSVTLHYRIDGGGWLTLSMAIVSDPLYEVSIGIHSAGVLIEYYISAIDSSPNNNDSTEDNSGFYYNLTVQSSDVAGPTITSIIHTPSIPTELDTITINVTVTDDSDVQSVTLNYRVNDGIWTEVSMTIISGDIYSVTIGAFAISDTIEYYITAIDNSINHNETIENNGGSFYSLVIGSSDATGPTITGVVNSPSSPTELDTVTINATVIDASGMKSVTLHYRVNGGTWQNISMTLVSGNLYSVTIGAFAISDTIEYFISAIDNSVNHNEATADNGGLYYVLTVGSSDVVSPSITDIIHSPSTPTELDTIIINATVTDVSGIYSVTLHYRINIGSWTEVSMTLMSSDIYSVTIGPFAVGDTIEYYISAIDNSVNHNEAINDNAGLYYSFTVSEVIPEFQVFSLLFPTLTFLFLCCVLVVLQRRRR